MNISAGGTLLFSFSKTLDSCLKDIILAGRNLEGWQGLCVGATLSILQTCTQCSCFIPSLETLHLHSP